MLLPSFLNTRSSADITTAAFASSALVVSVRMRRRVMGFLTAVGMAAVVVLGTAVPTSATVGDQYTVDDITYTVTSEDDATVAATSYSGATGASVVIASTVAIPGKTYTVTSIGAEAFRYKSLESVTIPDSVTSIGNSAFREISLTSVTIPNSVISIGAYAFLGNKLESVTIPDSLTSIASYAFSNNKLTSVTIPDSVISIASNAFSSNSLASVTIPDSVTSIASNAFSSNFLESVTIPNSVTSIGDGAFRYNFLESVTIPNSVIDIGQGAFGYNLLESVTIPSSVKTVDARAFGDNEFLTSVTFTGPAPTLRSRAGTYWFGDPADVQVYYYTEYGANVVFGGFTNPWNGYSTSIVLVVSLDLGLNVGDPVADAPVEINAEGLLVGSAYTVVARSTPNTIASGSASSTGTVSDSSGRMPSGLAAGPHTVTFTGRDADGNAVSRVAYLTVSDTGTVTYLSYTAAESLTLAETGFEVASFGAAALLLLAAGVALTLRRRRVIA
jgi:hypothetical protein